MMDSLFWWIRIKGMRYTDDVGGRQQQQYLVKVLVYSIIYGVNAILMGCDNMSGKIIEFFMG